MSAIVQNPSSGGGLLNSRIQKAVSSKIEGFSLSSKQITKQFEDILVAVQRLEHPELTEEWKKLRSDYRKLLWDHRDLFTNVATMTEQFATSMLPLAASVQPSTSEAEEVVQTIEFFLQTNDLLPSVQDMLQKMQIFQSSVLGFKQKIVDHVGEVPQQNPALPGNVRIKELQVKIDILSTVLDSINQGSLAEGKDVSLASLVRALLAFVPDITWGVLESSMGTNDGSLRLLGIFEFQSASLQKSIGTARAEIQRLEDQNAQNPGEKLRLRVQRLAQNNLAELSESGGLLQAVVNGVRGDATDVLAYFRAPETTSKPQILDPAFTPQDSLYIVLAKSLRDFAVGIASLVGEGQQAYQ